jgi:hypothetical protein
MIACGPKAATDQSLAADIQAKLASNDATRTANIGVAVTDGVVTLSGNVPSSDAALQAMTAANSTTGIKSVNNQMKVVEPAAAAVVPPQNTAPPPPAEPPPPVVQQQAQQAPSAPTAPREPTTVTIPAGRQVSVRMIDGIDTGRNHTGDTFQASLSSPITHGDRVIVPVGASATILLAEARGAGRVKGNSELELRLTSITYHREQIPVTSGVYEAAGKSRGKQSAIRTGIGAAAGALIGGLAGGGKGAGIGAAAGGGAGIGFQLLTHGQQIKIPSETQITFSLAAPLTLTR